MPDIAKRELDGMKVVGVLMATGLLLPLALFPATVALWSVMFLALFTFSFFRPEKWNAMGRRLITFFLPLAVFSFFTALVDLNGFSFFALSSLVLAYTYGRGLRTLFHWTELAWATTLVAFVIGSSRAYSEFLPDVSPEIILWVAIEVGKNPAGWTTAFGVVSLAALASLELGRRKKFVIGVLLSLLLLLLFAINSATSLIGAVAVVGAGVIARKASRNKLGGFRALPWLAATVIVILSGTLVTNYFFRWLDFDGSPLSRDFLTLTGRTHIWQCYLDLPSGLIGQARWQETLECLGDERFRHLHNLLLQAHLYGGWVLVILLVIGFAAPVLALWRKKLPQEQSASPERYFLILVLALSAIIGMTEPFVFWEMQFGAVVLFGAAAGALGDFAAPRLQSGMFQRSRVWLSHVVSLSRGWRQR